MAHFYMWQPKPTIIISELKPDMARNISDTISLIILRRNLSL